MALPKNLILSSADLLFFLVDLPILGILYKQNYVVSDFCLVFFT